MVKLIQAISSEEIEAIKSLFIEYAESLNFSLCFQDFDKEIESLPGKYSPPEGSLILAKIENEFAGCIALKKIEDGICEMKRLYVKPSHRGKQIGKILVEKIISDAKEIGYKSMRLDTVEGKMDSAIALYKEFGFKKIEKYYTNPEPHTLYMELLL